MVRVGEVELKSSVSICKPDYYHGKELLEEVYTYSVRSIHHGFGIRRDDKRTSLD